MPECEFKEVCYEYCGFCDDTYVAEKCPFYIVLAHYLNSPQFKEQYAKLPEDGKNPHQFTRKHPDKLGDLQQFAKFTAWNEGRAFGQQNPDPKQYARRVDLNKKIEELIVERNVSHILVSGNDVNRVIRAVQKIIQTHGLEE